MSTMTAFLGSLGSSLPEALPTIFSYWPTPGQENPPNVGDSDFTESIWTPVMRAGAANGTNNGMTTPTRKDLVFIGALSSGDRAELACRGRNASASKVVKTPCASRLQRFETINRAPGIW